MKARLKSFILLFFSLLISFAFAALPENQTLIDALTPDFTVFNDAAAALFPPQVLVIETPIAIRYAMQGALCQYTIEAACDPKSLSFFGRKDPISKSLCTETSKTVIFWYILHRLFESQFPLEAGSIATFLLQNGLEPFSNSTDVDTEIGWANQFGGPLAEYFDKDGWNSLGDETRTNYRQQYEDSTGYQPVNSADMQPVSLRRPLRWQPLIQPSDNRGRFTSQVHVTPHIGFRANPIVLTKQQLEAKKVPSPYKFPNLKRKISRKDTLIMKKQIKDLFRRNRALTKEQIAGLYWWDNKFVSVGSFIGFYQAVFGLDDKIANVIAVGETIAQHDAVIVGWKEKVRHDLVRPTTMVRRFLKGKKVRAFKSIAEGVGVVKADEWEPVLRIMPHSEYPSGSSLLCTVTMNQLETALRTFVGKNITIPPYTTVIPPLLLSSPVTEPVTVTFKSLKEAAQDCGQSRLRAGIHFGPSVPAGEKLAEGIGEMAFKHIFDLYEGRVPENCERCKGAV